METLWTAAAALRRHKLRSFLTLLGVIIGVTTVIAVVSVIAGLNNFVSEKLFQLNPDVYVVTQFGIITSRDEFLAAVKRKRITMADVEAIQGRCGTCATVGANVESQMPVKRGRHRLPSVRVQGSSANMAQLTNLELEAGRSFTDSEDDHSAGVAIIGSDVRDELFGRLDPVGREVWVAGKPLKVIGLLQKQGSILGQSQDNQLFMPLRTFRKHFGTQHSINVYIRPRGGVPALHVSQDEVRVILRNRRHTAFKGDDPMSFVSAEALQTVWKGISAGAFALMTFISGISLMVGGIVITNIMLVSVVERTREIGVRRAVGARSRDIQLQFLAEAVLLSLLGGIVGLFLGTLISKSLSAAFPLPTLIRPSLILAGLGIAVLTGAAAGYFPARKAANLPPVDALRWE